MCQFMEINISTEKLFFYNSILYLLLDFSTHFVLIRLTTSHSLLYILSYLDKIACSASTQKRKLKAIRLFQ